MKKFTIGREHMTKDRIIVYKLGNLDHKIMPTSAGIAKLRAMISNIPENGPLHLIWGPDLQVEVIDIENAVKHVIEPEDVDENIDSGY